MRACMRTFIDYLLSIKVSEEALIEIGYSAERKLRSLEGNEHKMPREGVGSTGLIGIAKTFGLEGFISKHGDREKLEFFLLCEIPILVNWRSIKKDGGHYSIVSGIRRTKKPILLLADPADGKNGLLEIPYNEFDKLWWDLSPKYNHWMAAFYHSPKVPFKGRRI